jgi:chromate transporter
VPTGLVDHDTFLAGYGAAQAVPGPLFTFAAFLGASMTTGPSGILGAGIALLAIFLPAGLLVIGILPFWERLRAWEPATAALTGVNAAVVGLLGAALYDPVFVEGITSPATSGAGRRRLRRRDHVEDPGMGDGDQRRAARLAAAVISLL